MNTAPSTSAAVASVPQAGTSGTSGLPVPAEKDKDSQWYFTAEELANSPSRRQGIDSDTELSYRQMTAYLIQEMGQRLKVSQLCINTAIVYMHRFYAFHSFTHFHRNSIASASLFLAAKVEEQPRKLEHVIKAANKCLNQPVSNTVDSQYLEAAQDLVFNENVLLQTLGFDVAIDHPHTHVVKTCHLVKACKDLTKTSYFLASNSLHLTSMCLQYRPTVVACFCIYLACKWSRWEIPQSTEGRHWFHYVDRTVTMEMLKQLTDEFIAIYEKSPARLKSKLNSIKALAQGASNNRPVVGKDGKRPQTEEWKVGDMLKMYHSSITISENSNQSGESGELQQQLQHSPHAMPMLSILPPPPPTQQQQQQQYLQKQQQIRKSDMHAGQQHRQQSSSHHSKHGFPPVSDMTDHKSSYKNQQSSQQPNFNGNNQTSSGSSGSYGSSTRMREHSQAAQQQAGSLPPPQSMGQVQRSNISMSTSNRSSGGGSSSGNSGHQSQSTNMRQQMPSGMPLDSHQNYQKIRERSSSMHSMPNSLHNAMPPHATAPTQHKLSSKSDLGSGGGSSGRMLAPKESSKHKMFGSTGSIAAGSSNAQTSSSMREFSNSQNMTTQGGAGSKIDNSNAGPHELSRGMLPHNQRSSYANSGSSNNNNNNTNSTLSLTNPVLSSLGYNVPPPAPSQQQQQSSQHRQANANMKLEHGGSKSLPGNTTTVHIQSQMHKSNLGSEAAYSNAAPHDMGAQQQQQQQLYPPQQSSSHAFASMMRNSSGASIGFDSMLGEDSLNSLYASGMLQQSQSHPQMKPSTSTGSSGTPPMYGSTDWTIQQMMNMPSNSSMPVASGNNNTTETNGSSHRALPHIKTELSPRSGLSSREKERDRLKVSPSTKKEKHRHSSSSSSSSSATAASAAFASNIDASNMNKPMQQQQLPPQQQQLYKKFESSVDQLSAAAISSGGNKRSLITTIKQEDEMLRESKQQKLDPMAAAMHGDSKLHSQVVNGIETNPDLVRSLLKESLCTTSALIKAEPLLTAPDIKPPAELFATPFDNQQQHNAPPQPQPPIQATSSTPAPGTQPLTTGNEAAKAAAAVAAAQQASDNAHTATLAEEPTSSKEREKHKKNKKEKHKHKEKDKSKDRDREERKKHKKDKDRHKDKERDSEREQQQRSSSDRPAGEPEQLKIKIRKDQIEGNSLNLPPFKIKIPKDRIKAELSGVGSGISGNGANATAMSGSLNQLSNPNSTAVFATASSNRLTATTTAATTEAKSHNPTLKIKISKDKIEGYTGCAYQQQQPNHTTASMTAAPTTAAAAVGSLSTAYDPAAAQQNSNFYASFFTSQQQQHSQQPQHQLNVTPSISNATSMSSHAHTHYSSSSSSKKKDRDRDRSRERDRERDKKRHCAESARAATSSGNSNIGTLSNVAASSSSSSSSHGHSSHPTRTHSSNRH